MNDEQFRDYIDKLRQQLAGAASQGSEELEDSLSALEGLQLIYEELRAMLEAAEVVEEELLQQNQQLIADYHRYYELFQFSPIAYLVTDSDGLILEANSATAKLLNVPQHRLSGKSLISFVASGDRLLFRGNLSQLSPSPEVQHWRLGLCPRAGQPFDADLHVATVGNASGAVEALRIGIYNVSQLQSLLAQASNPQPAAVSAIATPPSQLQAIDGLQVLVVDDETDVREFITAVLESHGIRVTAVATAAAALERLQRDRPDVLISDIRMPQEDGYSLIDKVRQLETQKGWHIPAAAITAYLEEDREKALQAGFEAYLHKLTQPSELIKLVAQLAGRGADR